MKAAHSPKKLAFKGIYAHKVSKLTKSKIKCKEIL